MKLLLLLLLLLPPPPVDVVVALGPLSLTMHLNLHPQLRQYINIVQRNGIHFWLFLYLLHHKNLKNLWMNSLPCLCTPQICLMASTNLFPCRSTQNAKHNEPKKKRIGLFLI
jgi:hypothetical protein